MIDIESKSKFFQKYMLCNNNSNKAMDLFQDQSGGKVSGKEWRSKAEKLVKEVVRKADSKKCSSREGKQRLRSQDSSHLNPELQNGTVTEVISLFSPLKLFTFFYF